MPTPVTGSQPITAPPSLFADGVRSWDRFWFTPMDPTTICFIRLLSGALAFYVCLTYSWGLFSYVGPHGWVDGRLNAFVLNDLEFHAPPTEWNGSSTPVAQGQSKWSIFFLVDDPGWIIAIHSFFLVCMLLYAVGLWCPYSGPLCWLGSMSYVQRAWATVYGVDTMLLIILAYLLIAPTGAVFSMDRWLAVRRARRLGLPAPAIAPSIRANFAIRLIQIHFCMIYFASGTSKLLGAMWWNATAMNQVLLNPLFTPMDSPPYYNTMKLLAGSRWVWELFTTLGNLFTLWMELSFIFLVWDRRWRWLLVIGSVLLHTGIGLLMGLTTFSIAMLIMVSSFMSPESVRLVVGEYTAIAQSLFRRRAAVASRKEEKLVMSR
jgi:hypothetical protein